MDSWYDLMILELSDLVDVVAGFGRDSDAERPLLPDPEVPEAGESAAPVS